MSGKNRFQLANDICRGGSREFQYFNVARVVALLPAGMYSFSTQKDQLPLSAKGSLGKELGI